mgnify:CR=1 FL=1
MAVFHPPIPFSRPEPMTKVERTFKVKWTKLACKKVGVMNLQTCPSFLIFFASFQPRVSRDLGSGARKSVFTILLSHIEIMNIVMSTRTMKTVKEHHLTVGQRLMTTASTKVSSLALLSKRLEVCCLGC